MTFFIIMAIILLFLCLVLFTPLGIGIKYENGAFIVVKLAFFSFDLPLNKLLRKKKKKTSNDTHKQKNPQREIEKGINKLDFVLSLFGDFRRFVRKGISLSEFDLKMVFGTSEAASTAVSVGMFYTLIYNFLGLTDKIVEVKNPVVKIQPMFNEATFSICAKGIIKTTLAHIIATAIVFAYKYSKYKSQKRRKSK